MIKKRKKPGYGIMMGLTIIATLAALLTLMPQGSASKLCRLGYKAHCSFTPISTLICLFISLVICKLRVLLFVKKEEEK